MKQSFLFGALLGAAAFLSTTERDAHACSMLATEMVTVLPDGSTVPADAPIFVKTAEVEPGSLVVEAKIERGAALDVVLEPDEEEHVQRIRPRTGEAFPTGAMSVTFRFRPRGATSSQDVTRQFVVRGSAGDYELTLFDARIVAAVVAEPGSPSLVCDHGDVESSCGPSEPTQIPSQWSRRPKMSFASRDPAWVASAFGTTRIWSVKQADGTVVEERGDDDFFEHVFATSGVEYCVEVRMAPRPGVVASPQSNRLCVANGDTRFDWSDVENDAVVVAKVHDAACAHVEAAPGARLPDQIAAEQSQGGCAVVARRTHNAAGGAGSFALALGIVVGAAMRRSRRR